MKSSKQISTILVTVTALLLVCFSSPATAALGPISSITATGTSGQDPIMLTSITVGGYTVNVTDLRTGTSSGSGGGSFPIANADNFNLYAISSMFNPHDVNNFGGGLWSNTNGDDPDFFIFESKGNDSGTIQAILQDGSLGNTISFLSGDWGATGYNDSYGESHGIVFSITDLKDASGVNLTNSSVIRGIRINSSGIDPGCICAVVVAVTPPEAPTITSTAVTTAYVGQLYTYDVEATGNPAPTFSLDVKPTGMTIDTDTGLIEWTPSAVGDFDVTVVASNGEDPNATQIFIISVSEPPPAGIVPITSITADGVSGPDPIMLTGVTVGSYTVSVSNLQNGTGSGTGGNPSFPVENADNFNINNFANTLNPHLIVNFGGKLFSDENGYNPDFFIFENGGNDPGTIQAIFSDDSLGNTISFSSSDFGDTGYNSSVGGQDIKGLAFEVRDLLDAGGVNLTNSSVIKGIRINSSGLDPSCVCAVTTPPALEPPTITTTPVTEASVGVLYEYDVDATGNPAPTYLLVTKPTGMTINTTTGLIEWTPDVSHLGLNAVEVKALNSEDEDVQSFDVNVPAVAPQITSTPLTQAYIGELYTYDVDADGVPAPTYSLLIFPAGMDINSVTGVIQWTPNTGQLGLNIVQVQATNIEDVNVQVFDVNVVVTPLCPIEMLHYWKLDEANPLYEDSYDDADANCSGDACPTADSNGLLDGCLDFDGDDYISTLATDDNNEAITVMAWVNPSNLSGQDKGIISKKEAFSFEIEVTGAKADFIIATPGGSYEEFEAGTVPTDAWTHMAATFDGTTIELFIDGNSVGTKISSLSALGSSTYPYTIGWNSHTQWSAERYFEGKIDEVAVFDTALSELKIKELYQRGVAEKGYCKERPEFTILQLISVDGEVGISGDLGDGFDLVLNGQPDLYELNLGPSTTTNNSLLSDGAGPNYFGFTLTEPNAALVAYFEAKHAGMPYKDELVAIANGENPIFYVKVEDVGGVEVFSLIDGFMLDTQILPPEEIYLRINGDYPEATYEYVGTIADEFGIQNTITVSMFVCIDADGDLICDSIECSVVNLNGLGVVNFEDFAMLGNNWMLAGPGLTGDVNNDEIVDNWDLTEIAEHWLSQCQ